MKWEVILHRNVVKSRKGLSPKIECIFQTLLMELEISGPMRPNWPNYGKLKVKKKSYHHCHLKKGKPTYVAIWEVIDRERRLLEVTYVGSHEQAPY